ncbi:uncharacterized protein DSM5745_08543 [Aspergillus mulundensis]|uniref:Aminoglycoside phosphotransferase domain-containing protein n=1 Tax=Aspergillus mulundensis TaxID=1810919 RepID=A0A3D8R3Z5_9EURO|nr:Uncharacterized protein DSM5745_08543 [Aspergillus mulundensis]RDW68783.1 Uncharacterized protein DSM5745_08543 [Aspergillus mulundensis]
MLPPISFPQKSKRRLPRRVNWDALCKYASFKNSDSPCRLPDQSAIGGVHLVRLLTFGDTQWIARVQLEPSTPATTSLLSADINVMEVVRARTNIRVPEIYRYEPSNENSVDAAFFLMEILPGEKREAFFKKVASIQVQLSPVRLPKIGSLIRRDDKSFDVGPLPVLGGPFSTATEFYLAWAKHARFPTNDKEIRKSMQSGPGDETLSSIHNFPRSVRDLAGKRSACDTGPFPLYHPDFHHSNIIVDDSFAVLGVIDWEGGCAVPWGPDNYDAGGKHRDPDAIRRLSERVQYARFVQEMESELGVDERLSRLMDSEIQGLAQAMKVYHDPGKLGFYCDVRRPFRK